MIAELPYSVIYLIKKIIMKKNYQTCLWIVFLFLTLFCSCTNDVDDTIQLVEQIVEVAVDGTSKTTVINYNGNKISSIDNEAKRSDFFYTANLITKIEEIDKANNKTVTLLYTYSNDNLVKITSSENYVVNYIHNSDGSVSYEKLTKDANNNDVKVYHGILYFKNSNLIKDNLVFDNAGTNIISKQTIDLEYDLRNNAFNNVIGFSKLLNYNKSISLNNSVNSTEVSEIKYIDTDQMISSINTFKSDYKYNSGGYPIEITSEKAILDNGLVSNRFKTLLYYK